jgi:hypothetical protein
MTGYELRVRGHLDPTWAAWLGAASLEHEPGGTTALLLTDADQAALHGVLTKLRDLGVPLVSLAPAGPAKPADLM